MNVVEENRNKYQSHEYDGGWDIEIKPNSGWLDINLRELWNYRDLSLLMVRRDFVSFYKQTILGPLWFFIQPILTTIVFVVVFGNIAKISTDGLPQVLFYLSGTVLWQYFSDCINNTADTFSKNANIFSKVYFPRVIVPLSVVLSNMIKLSIQFCLFLGFLLYFRVMDFSFEPNMYMLLFPVLVLIMAILGLGIGLILSALTTKYRDLKFLIQFGVQLLMYATPVIYPVSALPEKYKVFIMANPMTPIIEAFRYGFLGEGHFDPMHLLYAFGVAVSTLIVGVLIFSRIEKSFVDIV